MSEKNNDLVIHRTRLAFMLTYVLNTPFWAIFNMLPFIIYRDLQATPLQITLIVTLKPLVSIFSTYWSAAIDKRPDRLRSNLIWANIIGFLPFFLFPWVENAWYVVAAFGLYMMMNRGVIPAWMEILKRNIPGEEREKTFAYGSTCRYIGDGIFPFVLGFLLDYFFQAWRWVLPATAAISLCASFFQYRIPITHDLLAIRKELSQLPILQQLKQPWINAWELLKRRSDFAQFQIGFMLGGAGLMVMQPILTGFFMDVLKLSYTELAVALTCCKAIGFAATAPFWARWIGKVDIYRFSSFVTLVACLFPLFLISAQYHLVWLFIGYIIYGIMQAGSELSWNMSGPIFAKEEESSSYSSVNVLTVGLRGAVAPSLGSLLCLWTGPTAIMLLGGFMCLMATQRMFSYSQQSAADIEPAT